jgi:hypothetical protein
MNHYGISAIHWNAQRREIDEVLLHNVVQREREGTFALAHGKPAAYADVANLIAGGDTVWVMVTERPDRARTERGYKRRVRDPPSPGYATGAFLWRQLP